MTPSGMVPFVKASACGNDFLIIDGLYAPADLSTFTRRICDRHAGVGADGVEWLFPASDADVKARLLNADGSEAEISGNGTRCVAAHLCSEQAKERIIIRTGAGLKTCTLTARNGPQYEFEIAMGEPQVGDEFPIRLAFGEVRGIPISMGNPHYVVFVDQFAPGWQPRCLTFQQSLEHHAVARQQRARDIGPHRCRPSAAIRPAVARSQAHPNDLTSDAGYEPGWLDERCLVLPRAVTAAERSHRSIRRKTRRRVP